MAFDLDHLLLDEEKGVKGVKLNLGKTGGYIIAALPHSPAYEAEEARLTRAYADKLQYAKGDEEIKSIKDEIKGRLWFKTVILGWKNLHIEGKEYEYTEKNFVRLFKDFKYVRIAGILVGAVNRAIESGYFKAAVPSKEKQEEIAKK